MGKNTNELPWIGWMAPTRGRWHALVQAESYDACLDLLLASVQTNGDLIVLPKGRHPNDPQRCPYLRPGRGTRGHTDTSSAPKSPETKGP